MQIGSVIRSDGCFSNYKMDRHASFYVIIFAYFSVSSNFFSSLLWQGNTEMVRSMYLVWIEKSSYTVKISQRCNLVF